MRDFNLAAEDYVGTESAQGDTVFAASPQMLEILDTWLIQITNIEPNAITLRVNETELETMLPVLRLAVQVPVTLNQKNSSIIYTFELLDVSIRLSH